MLQQWADIVAAWEGRKRTPTLYPPSMHFDPSGAYDLIAL
jgi:hypothetical protein